MSDRAPVPPFDRVPTSDQAATGVGRSSRLGMMPAGERTMAMEKPRSRGFARGAWIAAAVLGLLCPLPAAAQSGRFDAGVPVTWAHSGEFDATTVGVGGRFAWHPSSLLGVEAEFNLYPSDWPERFAFSDGQREGLFGVTVGPRLGPVRPFAKMRAGFLNISPAGRPFPCVLIFPPPLSCQLAADGDTLLALDYGGGVEIGGRVFLRVEAGDRPVAYEREVLGQQGQVDRRRLWSHDFRFSVGAGLRF
jgi:hypothetical protein